jgi:hypothetical protein
MFIYGAKRLVFTECHLNIIVSLSASSFLPDPQLAALPSIQVLAAGVFVA